MPVSITPGVQIEERPLLPSSVMETDPSIPAFIGYTEKAMKTEPDDLLGIPQAIHSLLEYELFFGQADTSLSFILYHSMQLYFANGGGKCYIVSVGKYTDSLKKISFINGLDAVAQIDEPSLLVFPDAIHLPGNDVYEVQQAALQQAASLQDRFCIFDIRLATDTATHSHAVNEFRSNIGLNNLKHGAAYTPHVQFVENGQVITLPPSGIVAGIYCRTDKTRGVWKAPANTSMDGITGLAHIVTSNEQERLNIDTVEGKSINPIRTFAGRGFLVFGARTLAGNDNEWRFIPVRRLFTMVEESVKKATTSFVFEPNDANTWAKLRAMVENYLVLKWREGALQGNRPDQAFFVSVGLGQTMSAIDILEGRMIVAIGMAAVRPAEFTIIRFSQKMATS